MPILERSLWRQILVIFFKFDSTSGHELSSFTDVIMVDFDVTLSGASYSCLSIASASTSASYTPQIGFNFKMVTGSTVANNIMEVGQFNIPNGYYFQLFIATMYMLPGVLHWWWCYALLRRNWKRPRLHQHLCDNVHIIPNFVRSALSGGLYGLVYIWRHHLAGGVHKNMYWKWLFQGVC